MKISCKMAEDLLPLYLEDSCSPDSRSALEEHLVGCPACRAKMERMRSRLAGGPPPQKTAPAWAAYAAKVRQHRMRVGLLAVLAVLVLSAVFALVYLTLEDMAQQADPLIPDIEAGTCNLTAGDQEASAQDIGTYVFYTNYEQIQVTVQGDGPFQGRVMLWNVAEGESFIQMHSVDSASPECLFTGLSAAHRYRITCEGLAGTHLLVSEGRNVSFWASLRTVLVQLGRLLSRD